MNKKSDSPNNEETHSSTEPTKERTEEKIKIDASLLARAKKNDVSAIKTMFRQFIPLDEEILFAEYFGVQGLWWVGRYSFACLTKRRISSLMVGRWGEVVYQDGLLEHHNSGVVYQPSILILYVVSTIFVILALAFTFGLGLVLFPYVVKWYYRIHKCGLVWSIREGVSVYLFTNRNRLTRANQLYRDASAQHDIRISELPLGGLPL